MAVPPDLPPLPAKLEAECPDPGVPDIQTVDVAIAVIAANRIYAACEKQKHRDSNEFYRSVRIKLRTPEL